MTRRTIFLASAFLLSVSAFGQKQNKFQIRYFSTENGLPSNGIKGLQWDEKTNFLWIATEAGIVRFNGADFKVYTRENLSSIGTERMLFITRNNSGSVFASDNTGNIFLIREGKPVLWRKHERDANPYFSNYYLLSVSNSFFLAHFMTNYNPKFSSVTTTTACLSDTSFLILSGEELFFQSMGVHQPLLLDFIKSPIESLFKIGENYFYTNKSKEIFRLDLSDRSVSRITIQNENGKSFVNEMNDAIIKWQTGMEHPVLIENGNAWTLTYANNKMIAKLIFTGLPTGALIRSIQYSEKNGLLFMGTDSKGIIVLSRNRVESKKTTTADPKTRNSYYSQVELSNENILTNEGQIIGNNGTHLRSLPIEGPFSYYVSVTDDTLLWYSQDNKNRPGSHLCRYNYKTGNTKIFENITWTDVVVRSGKDYYLANYIGIGKLEADSLHFLYKYPPAANNLTFDIIEIDRGILAIASCNGLLTFNTGTQKLDTIFRKENICVRSIWKYKDYLFFGTYGDGFYLYKNGEAIAMPLDKNKYLLYTHCFVPDENGFCWISTNRGLFKASLAELINAFEKRSGSVYYHYFGKNDGMEMTELNGGCKPCALTLRNKTISFPTMDGLLWVDPEKAVPVLPDGGIYIDEILADNKPYDPDSIQFKNLPAKTNELIVKFAVPAWSNKENIYVDYQLNDSLNWTPVKIDDEAMLRFNNLPSGDYILRLRKLNGFGIDNYSYKTVRFHIITPWYKTWWFNSIVVIAIFGLVLLFVNLRTKQLKQNQARLEKLVSEKTKELQQKNEVLEKNDSIKTRLISIISHDIVTPLKFLTAAGKNLLEKRKLMPEDLQQETISEMTNTSQELQMLSTNILNWIKYQNENRRLAKEQFNLKEMIDQVFSVLVSLAKQKNLDLVNEVEKDFVIHQYFEPLRILIYNLVSNSINFTETGKIAVTGKKENEEIIISVKDEGVGMNPEQIKNIMADQFIISSANIDKRKGNGLGYLIIKDLLKTVEGSLHISSEKGKGTEVMISLPSDHSAV